MSIQRFDSNGRFSKAVVHNGTVYLSGLVGDPKDDIAGQTKTILQNIDKLLEQYGSGHQHLLAATIYLLDMRLFDGMNEVWDAWVDKGHEPTRTCIEARANDPRKLIEITVTAAVKE